MGKTIRRYIEDAGGTVKTLAEVGVAKAGNYLRDKKISSRYKADLPSTIMTGSKTREHYKNIDKLGKNYKEVRRYVKGTLQKRLEQLNASGTDADMMSAENIKKKLEKYTND